MRLESCRCASRHRPGRESTDEFGARPVSLLLMRNPTAQPPRAPAASRRALARARAGDEAAFRELTDPFRRELQVHCYRILGSFQDAEDVMQETMLAAWRGLRGFEERASLRAWLYRIATNRCLNARRDGGRRPEAHRAGLPLPFEPSEPSRLGEPLWLEPYPDALLEGVADVAAGPEARYEMKEAVALAFVTGLQRMAPRQRAVLVLRDVLGFGASEVAEMLDATEASVASALQRARATLDARAPADRARAPLPGSARERELVARFAEAFEHDDVDGVVALLTDDAWVTMPPEPYEYQGPAAIARFLRDRVAARAGRRVRLVPTRANGQPAFGHYIEDAHAPVGRFAGLLVVSVEGERISALTRFADSGVLARFGLPRTLPW
jgi:RNA polymerase sigma-70 factor (ECF subfamily)